MGRKTEAELTLKALVRNVPVHEWDMVIHEFEQRHGVKDMPYSQYHLWQEAKNELFRQQNMRGK